MVECHSCLSAAQTSAHLRDSERSIICESPVCPSGGLGIISWLSGALANRVVRGVTHTVTPKGTVDMPRRVIRQWVHEPSSVPQVPLLPRKTQGAEGLLPPMLMAPMSCLSAHHMQQAALHAHVLVYLCLVAERAHKDQHSSEGFTPSRWPCCTRPESIKNRLPPAAAWP